MNRYFDDFRMNMKFYREEIKHWTQAELAIQANSSIGQIGNIEAGNSRPSFENILAIAKALEIHPADLFLRDASKLFTQKDSAFIRNCSYLSEKQQNLIDSLVQSLAENTPAYTSLK